MNCTPGPGQTRRGREAIAECGVRNADFKQVSRRGGPLLSEFLAGNPQSAIRNPKSGALLPYALARRPLPLDMRRPRPHARIGQAGRHCPQCTRHLRPSTPGPLCRSCDPAPESPGTRAGRLRRARAYRRRSKVQGPRSKVPARGDGERACLACARPIVRAMMERRHSTLCRSCRSSWSAYRSRHGMRNAECGLRNPNSALRTPRSELPGISEQAWAAQYRPRGRGYNSDIAAIAQVGREGPRPIKIIHAPGSDFA
jgi:hypothetical protein